MIFEAFERIATLELVERAAPITVIDAVVLVPTAPPSQAIIAGPPGHHGLSAYQIAVLFGFQGTEAEWLASLEGEPGPPGPPGDISQVFDGGNF